MTGLFRKLFKNPNKALLLRAFTAAVTVAVFLAAMAFTVYAYFADCVISSSNSIQSASFAVAVQVTPVDPDGAYSCTSVDAHTYSLTFTPGTYTVIVARSGQSTASTGYCKITVGGSEYFTQQFDDGDPALTFTLQLSEDLQLTVSSRWGTYANFNSADPANDPYIIDDTVLDLRTEVTEPTESETTESETTEPEPTEPEPTDAEPTDAEPIEPEPTESEPADVETTEAPIEEITEASTETETTEDAPAEE